MSPLAAVVVGGGLLAVLIAVSAQLLPASEWFAYKAAAGYVVAAILVLSFAAMYPSDSFGLANAVTLLRSILTALLVGIAFESTSIATLWFCVLVATLALVLDGVDGWVARRRNEVTTFGARFDMETDAALMLVLCLLVWLLGRAGAWILLAGVMRYLFIGASLVVPWMQRALPASMRRKTACIVQLIALVVALGPIIPETFAAALAAAALAFLVYSFMLDVLWLHRHATSIMTRTSS